jgi:hypothetical protein
MSAPPTAVAEPFVDGLRFGECPRWHEGRLWYSDFFAGTVHRRRACRRCPGRGRGPRGAGRTGLASRRPPAGGGPQAAHRAAPGAPTVDWSSTGTSTPPPPSTPTTWWSMAYGRAYVGNFGFDLDRFIEEQWPGRTGGAPGAPTTPVGPRRCGRHRPRGRRRPLVPQRLGGHRRRSYADRGRDTGRPAHRVRHRGRRDTERPPTVGRAGRVRTRRDLPRRRRDGCGWPTP